MSNPEKQTQADGLLITYRCILSYCVQEQAKFSATYITPDIAQRIDETYAHIWHLKSQMRAAGLQVIDRPGDEPSAAAEVSHDQPSQSAPAPPSDQQPPESDARLASDDHPIAAAAAIEAVEQPYQASETLLFPAVAPEPPSPRPRSAAHDETRDVGDYHLFEPIAHQEHVIVYRAARRRSNWPLQIHVLRPTDTVTRDRFRQAARLMMRVRHPNIQPILALGEDEQLGDYLVTPPIATRTLQDLLVHGPLDPLLALRVFAQIGAALDELSSQGVRRFDLQPATILVAPQGVAYLTSFSLAEFDTVAHTSSAQHPEVAPDLVPSADPTRAGQVSTADLASLGALLYEMVCGAPLRSAAAEPPAIGALDPALAHVDPLIRALLAPPSDRRYANAGEVVAAARQAFPAPTAAFVDALQESCWEPIACWLENPLEAVFRDLITAEFSIKSRARADMLHRVGTIARLLERSDGSRASKGFTS